MNIKIERNIFPYFQLFQGFISKLFSHSEYRPSFGLNGLAIKCTTLPKWKKLLCLYLGFKPVQTYPVLKSKLKSFITISLISLFLIGVSYYFFILRTPLLELDWQGAPPNSIHYPTNARGYSYSYENICELNFFVIYFPSKYHFSIWWKIDMFCMWS